MRFCVIVVGALCLLGMIGCVVGYPQDGLTEMDEGPTGNLEVEHGRGTGSRQRREAHGHYQQPSYQGYRRTGVHPSAGQQYYRAGQRPLQYQYQRPVQQAQYGQQLRRQVVQTQHMPARGQPAYKADTHEALAENLPGRPVPSLGPRQQQASPDDPSPAKVPDEPQPVAQPPPPVEPPALPAE